MDQCLHSLLPDATVLVLHQYPITDNKLMLIVLWKQGFVCQIKRIHIFQMDLLFTEMSLKTSISELAMHWLIFKTVQAGIYCAKANVAISKLIKALAHFHNSVVIDTTISTMLTGDFIINLMQAATDQKALKK